MRTRPLVSAWLALALAMAPDSIVSAQRTSPQAPAASVPRAVQNRVERALLAIDSRAPASFWSSLGAEGLAALAAILDDGSRPVGLRRRAALALRHYDVPASHAVLASLARSPSEDEIVSRNALSVLTTLRGRSALALLEPALEDRRALVREGAAQALARLVAQGVLEPRVVARLLEPARDRENEPFVRLAFERALEARPTTR